MTSLISGVEIPDSRLAREAAELVRSYEDEMLFNHGLKITASILIPLFADALKNVFRFGRLCSSARQSDAAAGSFATVPFRSR